MVDWMSWLGRKSVGPGRSGVPEWLRPAGETGFATGYQARLDEVFRDNPVGQRCVRLVSGAVGGLVLDGHGDRGAAAVRLIKGELVERMAAALLLHGNAYVQLLTDSRGEPGELVMLRPERVSIATDAGGWPKAYLYRAGPGEAVRIAAKDPLERRQVAHVAALAPGNDLYGQGCLDAAIGPASVHNRAAKWNKALLDNAARPSGALTYAPGDGAALTGDQYRTLKAELEEMFSGAGNAGRPLLLEGGLSWQPMSLTPAEMDFIGLKESAARDVALAFGVPPVLVGLPGDATYANAREAGRALYRQTVLPMAARILDALGTMLADWWPGTRIAVDCDQLSELAEDRARLWQQVGAADFLTREEKRAMLGFEATLQTETAQREGGE